MDKATLKAEFVKKFGDGGEIRTFLSPGRVNLIGEHIDYNGGFVFPCAINYGTFAAARKRTDGKLKLASLNFTEEYTCDIKGLVYDEKDDWANYPKGVVKVLQDAGHKPEGMDILFYGNIPNGAGLSSSASIELATGVVANGLFNLGIDMIDLVKYSQKAENAFVGVNCGIMDQFAIGMGKLDQAILLDCNTLKYEYAPLKLGKYKLVIANSNKRRGLADSKYNERRAECDSALEIIKEKYDINALCEMTPAVFEEAGHLISDNNKFRRVRHAVLENQRTIDAVKFLKENNIESFGKLLKESHVSLRDDYEVTGFELDSLVEEAWKIDGVAGARMTGAGFGGCTVNIVREDKVAEFIELVGKNYKEKTGLKADFYVATPADGAGEI